MLDVIRDDDLPPTLPSGLDTTFGIGGQTSTAPGGDHCVDGLRADGKIVMAGGTFTDFVLARFNADGSLDTGFGAGGKVTTTIRAGLRSLRRLASRSSPTARSSSSATPAFPMCHRLRGYRTHSR